jgi:acetyltransferase-like isoleucine patch superfamily enzyme
MDQPAPIGSDAVIPGPARLSRLRLARLRAAARGRLEVRGRVRVEGGVRIDVAKAARVVLEDGSLLGERCRIEASGGTVRIGPGARLGARSVLAAHAGIDVGADCVVGEWVLIADTGPTYDDPEMPTRLQPPRAEPVRIGDRARIGAHAAVLAGAAIAPGAVVGSYAVVGGAVP